tara:strand:+ start:6639 stop:8873 length:2235 start_codon:yes stop_codon:yes gene_type:complete
MMRLWKLFFRVLLRLLYKVEVTGLENYEKAGERVLIIANHTSLLDGILLYAWLPETPTFAINTNIAAKKSFKPFLFFVDLFEMDARNPLSVKSMVKYLKQNKKAVIFPEGRITVTGSLMKIYEGPGLIADKSDATILPIAIEGAQYSRLSYMKGRGYVCWFPKVTVTILPPEKIDIPPQLVGHERRKTASRHLQDIMYKLTYTSFDQNRTIYTAMLDASKQFGRSQIIVEDIKREQLNYKQLILRSILLGSLIKKQTNIDEHVGVLLPNVNAMPIFFFALQFISRVPAMLNFTAGALAIKRACETAQVKAIYTSRTFIENAKLEKVAEVLEQDFTVIYLEDIKKSITLTTKLSALYKSRNAARHYAKQNPNANPGATAVILFTSGSEGHPKGVVLSHGNILANYAQVRCHINFTPADTIFNCLPLFHSFGLNAGFLMPLLGGGKVFLYPSPLHYRIIPELIYELGATIFFATDTFFKGYARFAHPFDLNTLNYVVAGAEKLHDDTVQLWMHKYGLRILQGYGVTEASPVISVNNKMLNKPGTAGRLVSAMEHYIKPVDGIEQGGHLVVKGPNIMQGYLNHDKPGEIQAPSTERGLGWYDTGDIADIDDEGFITILGRAKRFAKIGGEMVSLTAVEELASLTWQNKNHAAVAVHDERKGEKVILITDHATATRKQLQEIAKSKHMSELIIPKIIICIEEIPVLSTGKTDYINLTKLATAYNDDKEGNSWRNKLSQLVKHDPAAKN